MGKNSDIFSMNFGLNSLLGSKKSKKSKSSKGMFDMNMDMGDMFGSKGGGDSDMFGTAGDNSDIFDFGGMGDSEDNTKQFQNSDSMFDLKGKELHKVPKQKSVLLDSGNLFSNISTRSPTIPTVKSPKASQISSKDFKKNRARVIGNNTKQELIQDSVVVARKQEFTPENVADVPEAQGLYEFFDENNRLLYVGVSHRLKHRIQSYYQDDDFSEHPTKKSLRSKIAFFRARAMEIDKARVLEAQIKQNTPHNHG